MALAITDRYVDNFIDKIQTRLSSLDSELQNIAATSQRASRSDLQAGQTVPSYKPTTVCGAEYQEQAERAETSAYRDIEMMFDSLDRDVSAGRSEVASADAVATVTLALQMEPTEAELRDLWEHHRDNATLRKAIRKAASKAKVLLPTDPADAVADNRCEARKYALSIVGGRWTRAGMGEMYYAPSARIDAQSIRQHLMGVDAFGKPFEL